MARYRALNTTSYIAAIQAENMFTRLKLPYVKYNLILMITCWVAASFSFFLLNFLIKYMPGDIYVNCVISGLSAFSLLIEGEV